MKQSQPQNLFELEGLEQRILLSGDPLPGIVLAGLPEEPDSMFDTDPGLSPVEDVQYLHTITFRIPLPKTLIRITPLMK